MFRDRFNFVLIIALFMFTVFFFTESYIRNEVLLNRVQIYNAENNLIYLKYRTDLELSKLSGGKVNTYFPRYRQANLDSANLYGGMFDIRSNLEETEDSFIFSDIDRQLIVYKHVNKVEYRKDNYYAVESEPSITNEEAIKIAEQFFYDNLLVLNYEEALVEFEEGVFYIAFIGRLGNLKNMGFTDSIRLSPQGEVISLEYYYATYEKLGSLKIKSMYQAYHELPLEIAGDNLIHITDCQLVYIYEDSIVQPAYLFEGIVEDGTYFESFVKAISFD